MIDLLKIQKLVSISAVFSVKFTTDRRFDSSRVIIKGFATGRNVGRLWIYKKTQWQFLEF